MHNSRVRQSEIIVFGVNICSGVKFDGEPESEVRFGFQRLRSPFFAQAGISAGFPARLFWIFGERIWAGFPAKITALIKRFFWFKKGQFIQRDV